MFGKKRKKKPGPSSKVQPSLPLPDGRIKHVVGITGAFGSGCTTAAKALRDERGFRLVKLSDMIRARHAKSHEATREELQRLGDELRRKHGGAILVEDALAKVTDAEFVVLDGIRNVAEIDLLQKRFGHSFTLIAIIAPTETRWHRIEDVYTDRNETWVDFEHDDARDRNEETPWGQQVELCVDRSDVFLVNAPPRDQHEFKTQVVAYVDMVTGITRRHPTQEEILMNMAYAASHSSKCLKRHVGAIVVDAFGQVVAVGYNENPLGTNPCVEEPTYGQRCYRDIVRNDHFAGLASMNTRCPSCGKKLPALVGPPWRCPSCEAEGKKTNLEAFFFPDRAMNWCTAIHAEVWGLLAAGERSRGGSLYTTTFPCFQCAEKIAQAGIRKVIYTEVYPDVKSAGRLDLAKIDIVRFEGIRSSKFERIFPRPV